MFDILAWAAVREDDVEARHLAMFGRGFRKIGTYVKFAQVGAVTAMHQAGVLGGEVGVFLGTGLGNTEVSIPVGEGILHAERPWCSPMAFAGSVGNSAPFYIARSLELAGMNVTVTQEELSFEAALLDASVALQQGYIDIALVGGVDVLDRARVPEHLSRLDNEGLSGIPASGAGWFCLARAGGRATLLDVRIGRGVIAPQDGDTLYPGWRSTHPDRETRMYSTPQALRLCEVLDAGTPQTACFTQSTRSGTQAMLRVRLP